METSNYSLYEQIRVLRQELAAVRHEVNVVKSIMTDILVDFKSYQLLRAKEALK